MAIPVWKGGATAVALVQTITKGDAPGDTAVVYYITLENRAGESHKVTTASTVADTTTSAVCSAIAEALAAATAAGEDPWDEVTCETTTSTAVVTITADSGNEPFWITGITSNETATLTSALVTAAGGANIWADSDNWDAETIPGAGDTPTVPAAAAYDIYGQVVTTGVTTGISGLTVEEGSTINFGTHDRPLELLVDTAAAVTFNLDGSGEGYLKIMSEAGTATAASVVVNITGAGAGSAVGAYGWNIVTPSDSAQDNQVYVACEANEKVGLAARAGDVAELAIIKTLGGDVTIGSGATSATIALTVAGGTVYNSANLGVLTGDGGGIHNEGAATLTSANINTGATLYQKSSGTLSSGTIAGTIDFSRDMRAHVVDSSKGLTLQKGAVVRDPHGTVGSPVIQLGAGVSLGDVTVDFGTAGTYKKT